MYIYIYIYVLYTCIFYRVIDTEHRRTVKAKLGIEESPESILAAIGGGGWIFSY